MKYLIKKHYNKYIKKVEIKESELDTLDFIESMKLKDKDEEKQPEKIEVYKLVAEVF